MLSKERLLALRDAILEDQAALADTFPGAHRKKLRDLLEKDYTAQLGIIDVALKRHDLLPGPVPTEQIR